MEKLGGKIYVKVIAEFSESGHIRPLELIWDDEHTFEITRLHDVKRAPSKAGGLGYRYSVTINGEKKYLWLEDMDSKTVTMRWFVEAMK